MAQSKTKDLDFPEFKIQNYLKILPPSMSSIIFKARSKTLDIKSHTPFLYNDTTCRGCGTQSETLSHIISCVGNSDVVSDNFDLESALKCPTNSGVLRSIAERVILFFDTIPSTPSDSMQ